MCPKSQPSYRSPHFFAQRPLSRNRQVDAMPDPVDLAAVDLLPRLCNLLQDRLERQVRARDDGGGLVLEADFVRLDACRVDANVSLLPLIATGWGVHGCEKRRWKEGARQEGERRGGKGVKTVNGVKWRGAATYRLASSTRGPRRRSSRRRTC